MAAVDGPLYFMFLAPPPPPSDHPGSDAEVTPEFTSEIPTSLYLPTPVDRTKEGVPVKTLPTVVDIKCLGSLAGRGAWQGNIG